MRNFYLLISILLTACTNHQGQNKHTNTMVNSEKHKFTNSLIHETSPYLLQHAHNPVDWYAWGDEAFDKAKKENKLVLISIGYAACHWCHVMEHESFENEAIADIMNENFVCIKVDREERPDIDKVYMSAVQLMTGRGGWPLNCFALPDGRPVYGGTYFQPKQWIDILKGLSLTYKNEPSRVENTAKEISQGLQSHELISVKSEGNEFNKSQADKMFDGWQKYFDSKWGGNKSAPKFPLPISYQFMLQYGYHTQNSNALNHLNLTLTKIAQGGIYDQVGGGFARYSVDEQWKAPHFEKMLYDNGQLVSLYSNVFKKTKNPYYKRVVNQSLEFVERELTTKEGAFYSSYDADSEGVEGKFYVWTKPEIEKILEKDADWYCSYYNVTDEGNWEESNILWVTDGEKVMKKHNFTEEYFYKELDKANNKLLKERATRIYPGLDDKVLTSWNALMSIGYLDAFEAFGDTKYLEIAIKNGLFIKEVMLQQNGGLNRNYKNNKTTINAFLDDYALTIQLFTKLYQNTFDQTWLDEAKTLLEYVITHFYDVKSGMFFYTSDLDAKLITRKMELSDNVIPASNSIMANNLFDLSVLYTNNKWREIAAQMLSNITESMESNASYYANWGILLNKFAYPFYEVVFMGKKADKLRVEFLESYHPNVIIAGQVNDKQSDFPLLENRWVENQTIIYVCQNKVCKLPVKSVNEAFSLIQKVNN